MDRAMIVTELEMHGEPGIGEMIITELEIHGNHG